MRPPPPVLKVPRRARALRAPDGLRRRAGPQHSQIAVAGLAHAEVERPLLGELRAQQLGLALQLQLVQLLAEAVGLSGGKRGGAPTACAQDRTD